MFKYHSNNIKPQLKTLNTPPTSSFIHHTSKPQNTLFIIFFHQTNSHPSILQQTHQLLHFNHHSSTTLQNPKITTSNNLSTTIHSQHFKAHSQNIKLTTLVLQHFICHQYSMEHEFNST